MPPKKRTPKEPAKEQSKQLGDSISKVIVSLITLIKDIGLPGFLVSSFVLLIIGWGSTDQKREIIDRYVLFKSGSGHIFCGAIIAGLVVIMTIGVYYYRKILSLERKEIERLSDWKTERQNIFERPLNSSK